MGRISVIFNTVADKETFSGVITLRQRYIITIIWLHVKTAKHAGPTESYVHSMHFFLQLLYIST